VPPLWRRKLSMVWGLAEAEGLVLQNDSWVAGVGEHSRW
jgi:hypothetical protein